MTNHPRRGLRKVRDEDTAAAIAKLRVELAVQPPPAGAPDPEQIVALMRAEGPAR